MKNYRISRILVAIDGSKESMAAATHAVTLAYILTYCGASNFFELAVAVSTILFGVDSGVTLAITVGVLVEVPVMLSLVAIMKRNKSKFNFNIARQ
jgi:ACR3 family arsenite efflux pump ArsB